MSWHYHNYAQFSIFTLKLFAIHHVVLNNWRIVLDNRKILDSSCLRSWPFISNFLWNSRFFTNRAFRTLELFLLRRWLIELNCLTLALHSASTRSTARIIGRLEVTAARAEHLLQFRSEAGMRHCVQIRISARCHLSHDRRNHRSKRWNGVCITKDAEQRDDAIRSPGEDPLIRCEEKKVRWEKFKKLM